MIRAPDMPIGCPNETAPERKYQMEFFYVFKNFPSFRDFLKIRTIYIIALSYSWNLRFIPPFTLTLLGSNSMILILARATTEKASLISNIEMSSFVSPHSSRTLDMAATGAVGKSIGANAASANPAPQCRREGNIYYAPQTHEEEKEMYAYI